MTSIDTERWWPVTPPTMERHANTQRYVAVLTEADDQQDAFTGIVRQLADPLTTSFGDIRGPIADLVEALEIVQEAQR